MSRRNAPLIFRKPSPPIISTSPPAYSREGNASVSPRVTSPCHPGPLPTTYRMSTDGPIVTPPPPAPTPTRRKARNPSSSSAALFETTTEPPTERSDWNATVTPSLNASIRALSATRTVPLTSRRDSKPARCTSAVSTMRTFPPTRVSPGKAPRRETSSALRSIKTSPSTVHSTRLYGSRVVNSSGRMPVTARLPVTRAHRETCAQCTLTSKLPSHTPDTSEPRPG